MAAAQNQLRKLAGLYGVQASYTEVGGRRRGASAESLLRILAALGAPVQSIGDVPEAIRLRQREWWGRLCEPAAVAWEGNCPEIEIRLPEGQGRGVIRATLRPETGETKTFDFQLADLPVSDRAEVEGTAYVVKRLPGLGKFPNGYYQLRLETEQIDGELLLISAPRKAFSPEGDAARSWGIMAPLYAIHSAGSWGAGNLSDLASLWHWVDGLGGQLVATLPMLAAFLDEPFDPSPYAPVSRRFWNEFYADPRQTAEFARCPAVQDLLNSTAIQQELADFRRERLIDYRRQMALRRQVFDKLAECCFTEGGERLGALRAFTAARPEVEDYARFRAVTDRLQKPWPQWPAPLRDGRIQDGDYDLRDYRRHLYAQWIVQEQMESLSADLRRRSSGLYLDLPLGVHRHGFDTWRCPDLFAFSASGGAPPDSVFTQGQDWDFAPLRPEHIRADGYRHVLDVFRGLLRHAGMLRIDHVMGLHRLYWIPEGMPAADGAFVRYPAEELYALLCLESHRHRAWIVGENLGTVPAYVNAALRRHAVHRTYVVQYELAPRPGQPLNVPEPHAVAAVDTHDMPPFTAFWNGADLDDLHALGLFDKSGVAAERARRWTILAQLVEFLRTASYLGKEAGHSCPATEEAGHSCLAEPTGKNACPPVSPEAVYAAVISWLAASPAQHLLITLEDLWSETQPQNTPGTSDQRPNWRVKMRYSLEEIQQNPRFRELLAQVDQLRHDGV
ncbi:MAG: 4-alpha-glucanotransferase [Pirellulales bacterium]|nr:4-alpha-glucanotransferase [Pirellulales bacterium]